MKGVKGNHFVYRSVVGQEDGWKVGWSHMTFLSS